MRIVMLTTDLAIDRRILQEAYSLIRNGHEVILLAGWNPGMDQYEKDDGVKIHRIIYDGTDKRWAILIYAGNFVSLLANRAAHYANSRFNTTADNMFALGNRTSTAVSVARERAYGSLARAWARFGSGGWWALNLLSGGSGALIGVVLRVALGLTSLMRRAGERAGALAQRLDGYGFLGRQAAFPLRMVSRVVRKSCRLADGAIYLVGKIYNGITGVVFRVLGWLWLQVLGLGEKGLSAGYLVAATVTTALIRAMSSVLYLNITTDAKAVSRLLRIGDGMTNRVTSLVVKCLSYASGLTGFDAAMVREAIRYEPDVVHAHDLPVLKAGAAIARKTGCKVVYDAHELYPEIGELPRHTRKLLHVLEKRLIKRVDAAITVNEFIADEMARRYSVRPPHVIYNSTVVPKGFDPGRRWNLLRKDLSIPEQTKIVLFQGWISLYRSLDDVVRAAALFPRDVCLVLMGYGSDRQVLENLVDELNLRDRVFFRDAVPQNVLLRYSASADIGLIPYRAVDLNHYFCSPNKLFEFVQAELPILANDLPFLTKTIRGRNLGLTAELSTPEQIAEAVSTMLRDPQTYQGYKQALRGARAEMHWNTDERTLLRIYENLSGAPAGVGDVVTELAGRV